MRITIEYDSCWQTGFLDGDPNKQASKRDNPRKFVATSKTRGEKDTPITDNTVLGVLCRLIGDQRKLYQARNNNNFYFSDIQKNISWRKVDEQSFSELIYLTNKSDDRCSQGTWLGVLSDDNPWFFSEVSSLLWSILYLERDELLDFVVSENIHKPKNISSIDCRPKALLRRLDQITDSKSMIPWKNIKNITLDRIKLQEKLKSMEAKKLDHLSKVETKPPKAEKQLLAWQKKLSSVESKVKELRDELAALGSEVEIQADGKRLNGLVQFLEQKFPSNSYWSDNGLLYPAKIYAASLYLQAEHMIKQGYNLDFAINKKSEIQIQGFSKCGFNGVRDWLNPMAGKRKKAVGTPCQVKKQSGKLHINIDVNRDKALEILALIENAGVSAFYLGKKGLAYVTDIRV